MQGAAMQDIAMQRHEGAGREHGAAALLLDRWLGEVAFLWPRSLRPRYSAIAQPRCDQAVIGWPC
eukprot:scaffold9474_cov19-Tisochrysis_lutea.AAC.6